MIINNLRLTLVVHAWTVGWTVSAYENPSTQLNPTPIFKPILDANPIQPSPSSHSYPKSSYPCFYLLFH